MFTACTALVARDGWIGHAQTTVTLTDTSQTTVLTANVSEQARVSFPSGVTFNVTNIAAITAA